MPVTKKELRPQTRRAAEAKESQGQKPPKAGQVQTARKREAMVASVYEIDRHERTAEEFLSELRPVREATKKKRPSPQNKVVWA